MPIPKGAEWDLFERSLEEFSDAMLDANVSIDAIRDRSRLLVRRIRSHSADDIAISVITLPEHQHGVAKSSNPEKNRVAMLEFLVPFATLPFDDLAARASGQIRASLVTNNLDEVCRVPGLSVENWIVP